MSQDNILYTVGGTIKRPAIRGLFPRKNETGPSPLIFSAKLKRMFVP